MAQMMDGPLPRSLKIGKISIGLIGLDIALNRFGRDLSFAMMMQQERYLMISLQGTIFRPVPKTSTFKPLY